LPLAKAFVSHALIIDDETTRDCRRLVFGDGRSS
jgi:hypothetical protein